MRRMQRVGWAAPILVLSCLSAPAQPPPPPAAPAATPPTSTGVAARVNGQPIPETAVQRALQRVSPEKREEARKQVLDYLVGNLLIDQYVLQLPPFAVDKKDIDQKEDEFKADLKKQNKDVAKVLEAMKLTEADLREQIAADLRWNKYCDAEATNDRLKQLFDSETEVFDGSMVRARHILLTPDAADAKAVEAASAQLRAIKKDIEARVEEGMAKCTETDPLNREKKRRELLDDVFAAAAKDKSQCPSKAQGGDVDYFARSTDPFSKAAFALKPYQMSDVVQTDFGVHLILVTDHKKGLDVKFDDVKDDVKDEFCDRLREQVVAKVKPHAKIEVMPAPKPDPLPAPMPK